MYVLLSESQAPTPDLIEGLEPVYIEYHNTGDFRGYYSVLGNTSDITSLVKIKGDITNFICVGQNLTKIDVSNAPNLIELRVDNNELESLDVSKNFNLKILECDDNQLKSLDVSKNVKLETLYCGDNQLTSLNLTVNVNLKSLNCSENQMTSLLVSNQVDGGFEYLAVYKNNLNEAAITALIKSMPTATNSKRNFYLKHSSNENNAVKDGHVSDAKAKEYNVLIHNGSEWVEK